MHRAGSSFRVGVESAARIAVSPDSLAGLARAAAASAPPSAALVTALAAGAQALVGLSSAAALADVGQLWARQVEALHIRWTILARDVEQARLGYSDIDEGLAS